MKVYTEITADLQKVSTTQDVRAAVGDTGRGIRVRFSQNGEPYVIEKDCYAVLMGTKDDGTSLFNSCRLEDNAAVYDFTEQTCSRPGSYPVQVRLYGPDKKILTSVPLEIHVYDTAYEAEQAAASRNEQTALDELVNRTRGLMLDLARKQETGGFDGESAYETAVRLGYTGSEESWIQSLKYDHSAEFTALASQVREHTKQAASSAAGADQARTDAETAASEAASSASGASGSEQNAAASETAAAASSASALAAADRAEQAVQSIPQMLDDSAVSEQKTQSSLKLYDSLCLPFAQTGPLVTCHPVENYPLHVVSQVPSGQSAVDLTHCGEELFNAQAIIGRPAADRYDLPITLKEGTYYCSDLYEDGTFGMSFFFRTASNDSIGNVNTGISNVITFNKEQASRISKVTLYTGANAGKIIKKTSIIRGAVPKPFTPYVKETFSANVPAGTTSLDWTAWEYTDGTGTHPMAGEKPAIKAGPGVNNLFSTVGDTEVSGRQDPVYTAETLISRVTALENSAVKEI